MNSHTRRLIETLYAENSDLREYLIQQGEISFVASVDKTFNKVLLLAIASYFEKHITDLLIQFFTIQTNNNQVIMKHIIDKTIERKYFQFFDSSNMSKKSGINPLIKIFGDDFKKSFDELIKSDKELESGILQFLELSNKRNELVHENFIDYLLQYSPQEIYVKFTRAVYFVDTLERQLNEHFAP
ncbi:MAG: HEPN domain-containing protein [Phototrophicaceae bacterium]